MSYAEQLARSQLAALDRALENYAARCDRLATEQGPENDRPGMCEVTYIEEDDGSVHCFDPARDGFVDPRTGVYYPPLRR